MRKFIISPLVALIATIGLVATGTPANATNPCPGSSCDAVLDTRNDAAQFNNRSYWCVSSTQADIAVIEVKNQASDHSSHTFTVQIRREQPTNIALWTSSATISYGGTYTFDNIPMSSVAHSNQPYLYVERVYDDLVQRNSLWHTLGDYPTWAQVNVGYSTYGGFDCS